MNNDSKNIEGLPKDIMNINKKYNIVWDNDFSGLSEYSFYCYLNYRELYHCSETMQRPIIEVTQRPIIEVTQPPIIKYKYYRQIKYVLELKSSIKKKSASIKLNNNNEKIESKNNTYRVTVNFVELNQQEIDEKENKIISILIKNAIKILKEKKEE